jgi:ABC-type multidrug transport system ATPase subunit
VTTYGVTGATVRFGATTALDDVTLRVAPGEIVVVVGGDGAGKSTLLRTLAGEVVLESGTIEVPDAQRLGYLTASAGSWAGLTVVQNMDFVGGVYGLTGTALDARRDGVLDRAGLRAAGDRVAAKLSGGMRRKLGFSMAVQHQPPLLVLDEPSTGVDPVSRVDLWRLVAEAASAGAAVVMSTTYLDEAERATYLIVLDEGRVLVEGPVDDVLASLPGTVTRSDEAVRQQWSWRRGRVRHEYWPNGAPDGGTVVTPDLEDVVIALSLARRAPSEVTP